MTTLIIGIIIFILGMVVLFSSLLFDSEDNLDIELMKIGIFLGIIGTVIVTYAMLFIIQN
jgi:hypothetical protein